MSTPSPRVAVIGAGPAGLMAADILSAAGVAVDVYDAMPSVGRKFLLAGIGGMNITHSEPLAAFIQRYAPQQDWVADWLGDFSPTQLRAWIHAQGIDTFVGTSGRVFPTDMKAAPLLRSWLARLRSQGVQLHPRHRWLGWHSDGSLHLQHGEQPLSVQPAACVLALGGASWPKLGSDGHWLAWLSAQQIACAPLQPANCGFTCPWSEHLKSQFAGAQLKPIAVQYRDERGAEQHLQGEFVLTEHGVEGSLIYAISRHIRQQIADDGRSIIHLDLLPQRSLDDVQARLSKPRGKQSLGKFLRAQLKLDAAKVALLHELSSAEQRQDPTCLAALLKRLPLPLSGVRPIAEAISSAGGVTRAALDDRLMLKALPGTFCAGEMLDWEAPTGGYLLTACFASGVRAGQGALAWLNAAQHDAATAR
ncbi:TIGR03862 family flavoprotein [Atopomonas sediminilitoris]|uniref:TIGR03862 family flavoprotein n=1 Tax=Atopomonas sediminilitoris TaxID=2919919 RepID=UPI001F4D69D3|nr:TIGR03862 family flavoprotein [Atopomonas sediminilitoris]MCJ8168145.1 TIGR03862 family flavoprotein [Atopomonas sediminilitoris]